MKHHYLFIAEFVHSIHSFTILASKLWTTNKHHADFRKKTYSVRNGPTKGVQKVYLYLNMILIRFAICQ